MKSFTILLLASLAAATKSNGIRAASGNSTDVNQGSGANAEAGNNNQGNSSSNASDVIQVQNGQQCINVDALNDPKCVSTIQ